MPPAASTQSLELPGYSVQYELIDGHIYHVRPIGFLRSAHVQDLLDMHHRNIWQWRLQAGAYDFLFDGSRLSGASANARRLFREGLRRVFELHPFRSCTFYGFTRLVAAAIRVVRPFVPYPVRIEKDFDTALKKLREQQAHGPLKTRGPGSNRQSRSGFQGSVIDRYADELLYFLGCFNEDRQAFDSYRLDTGHPFLPVFDAIRLLKADMDELLQHRIDAEEELRRNESKYRRIFENIQDIYFETALDGTILELSPSVADYFQYRRQDLIGTDVGRIYRNPKRRDDFVRALQTEDQVKDFQTTLMDKNGTPVACSLNAFLTDDPENHTTTIVGSLRDISKYKELERVLRENEERYRNLYQTSLVGLYRSRISDGKLLSANRTAAEIFGFKDEKSLMEIHRLAEYYDPERRRELLRELEAHGEVSGFEFRFDAPDGTSKDLAISSKIYPDKGYIEGMVLDVTQRKATEKALRETEGLSRSLFDGASDAIFIHDPETGRFTDGNRVAFQRLGYTRQELLSMGPAQITLPEIAERIPERLRLLKNQGHLIYECIHVRKDGSRIPVEISSQFIEYTGRPLVLSIARDITDRKLSEAALKTAKESAEAANVAKSQFLANMSHEIRTPMNGIIGTCDLLLDTDLNPNQRELLDILKTSGNSLLSLINDILDLSKIEAGKLELEQVAFSVRKVMEDVADTFLPKVTDKAIELVLDIPPDLPEPLVSDPLRLRQVLVNLVGNALKFTKQGEICIGVRCREDDGDGVVLAFAVRDTGIGIAPQYHQSLFSAFTQADGSVTRKYGGTGLGLAICHRLVTLMQGEISLESQKGSGSTFCFTARFARGLPRACNTGVFPDTFAPPKTLLVAPDTASRQVLVRYLSHFGFKVRCIDNGMEAASVLISPDQGKRFGLLMLDGGVAGIVEAAKALEQHQTLAGPTPVILVGRPERYDRPDTIPQGMTVRVLSKPIKQSPLLDALMDVFGHGPVSTAAHAPAPGPIDEFRGLRVLLVEDNRINRRLAREMLKVAGIEVEAVADGFQAVEAVRTEPFDAVLMDLQMPEMDGIEATRAIRRDLGRTDLPIIALTAHSMYGDREKCLEAGMNDYVSKPIDRQALFAALRRTLRKMKPGSKSPPGPPVTDTAAPETPGPAPGLDIAQGMARLGNDWPLYLDILEESCDVFREMTAEIHGMVSAGDLLNASKSAHSLKGAAGNVSAIRLFEAARKLESACREDRSAMAKALAGEVDAALEELTQTVGRLGVKQP